MASGRLWQEFFKRRNLEVAVSKKIDARVWGLLGASTFMVGYCSPRAIRRAKRQRQCRESWISEIFGPWKLCVNYIYRWDGGRHKRAERSGLRVSLGNVTERGNLRNVVESYLFVSLDSDRGRSASRLMSNTNNLDVGGHSFTFIWLWLTKVV